MITLYRIIPYPDHTFILFQGDDEDFQQASKILHFKPIEAKKEVTPETGYCAFLRGEYRAKSEKEMRQYLSSHYQPPMIELSAFRSTSPLPDIHTPNEWATIIAKKYAEFFKSKGYIVNDTGEYAVFRKQAITLPTDITLPPELDVFEGVTYRVQVPDDYHLTIQCDVAYGYYLENEPVSWKKIAQQHAAQPQLLKKLDDFTKRDTNDLFKLFEQFIKSLQSVPDTEDYTINPTPLKSTDLSLETWFWEHDYPVSLEVSNNQQVPLAQWIVEHGTGFYKPHSNPIKIAYLFPDEGIVQWCPKYNKEQLSELVRNTLQKLLLTEPPIYSFEYATDRLDTDGIIASCRDTVEYNQGDKILTVMINPPKYAKDAEDPKLQALDKFAYELSKQLRRLWWGGYSVTLDWTKLQNPTDRKYIMENAILKGLLVLGARPWKLANFPLVEELPPSQVCIIGIDAQPEHWDKGGAGRLGGVVFDGGGILRAFHLVRIQDNEFATPEVFHQFVKVMLNLFKDSVGQSPKYLLIHRDGIFGADEAGIVLEYAQKIGMTCDLVEICKSGTPRFRQRQNRGGTASKDVAVGSEELGIAYMCNTLVFRENGKYPAPQTIWIRHVSGTTPLKVIAVQVMH